MLAYAILFLLIFFLVPFDFIERKNPGLNFSIFIVLTFLIISFSGLRYGISGDYFSYKEMFDQIHQTGTADGILIEPGFLFFNMFFARVGLPYQAFIFFIAFLSIGIKSSLIRKMSPYPILSLVVFFVFFFVLYDMGAIRRGLACSFIMLSFYYKILDRKRLAWMTLVFASLIHASALVVAPFLLINQKKELTYKKFVLIIGAAFLGYFVAHWGLPLLSTALNFDNFLVLKFNTYFDVGDYFSTGLTISLGLILRILLVFALIRNKRSYTSDPYFQSILNSYVFSIFFLILFSEFAIFASIATFFKIFEIILIPLLLKNLTFRYKMIVCLLLGVYLFLSLKSLITNPLEPDYNPYHWIL